jgi:imidazolonepropionase-like amidohydrolase
MRTLSGAVLLAAAVASLTPAEPVAAVQADSDEPQVVLFRGATIWTMGEAGILAEGDLLIRDGKVAKVAARIDPPRGAVVVEAAGKHITPGLIDCHSHMAVEGGVNEGANNVTAEVRIADVHNPDDINIYRALAGGLTTANVLHGSANSIGGQNSVIKMRWGQPASALPMKEAPPGIKFALGENPKRSNFSVPGRPPRYPATRMGVAASIRKAFLEAQDYRREWAEYERLSAKDKKRRDPPRRDLQKEALVEILEGKRLVHSHSYRQDEILMLIRLAEEFGFKIATFQHVLEGYKVADEMAAHGAGASTFSDWWAYKFEVYDAIPYNGALMTRRGVVVSFNSDSSELARRMNLEAAKAVKYGELSAEEALALVTINPAKQLGIDRWVGSLDAGKHADLALWNGDPMSTYTLCEQTWVDGVKLFDRAEDLARREGVDRDRAALIDKVKTIDLPKQDREEEEEDGEKPESDEVEAGAGSESPAEAEGTGTPTDQPIPSKPSPPLRSLDYRVPSWWDGGVFALVGATVHPVSAPAIPDGTIVVRHGRIEAVGASGGVTIPPDAEVIRLDGLHVYPGMIEANSVLGLTEVGSVRGSVDTAEAGQINPAVRAEIAVNPDSELIPVTRANGITHVLTAPRGGLISGTSALVRLDGWTWEDLTAAAPAALHVQYPRWRAFSGFFSPQRTSKEERKKQREEALEELRQTFTDARAYRKAKEAAGNGGVPPDHDPALEAMLPVIRGEIPVVVHAQEVRQIKDAVSWAGEEGIRLVIAGGEDSWRVADLLAEKSIPVILGPVLTLPDRRDEPYDTPFTTAKKLHEAGVRFCISGGGGASNARNLPYHAAMAAAFGLPVTEAIRSVTLYPAQILGVGENLGSIEAGKSASFMVTDGDPLEIRTQVIREFIDGRPIDLMNRHRRLYERYTSRPLPGASTASGRAASGEQAARR